MGRLLSPIEARAVAYGNERLRPLYKLVEDGAAGMDDAILKDRIKALRAERDRMQAALARVTAGARPTIEISRCSLSAPRKPCARS